jgi:hypothetical protein
LVFERLFDKGLWFFLVTLERQRCRAPFLENEVAFGLAFSEFFLDLKREVNGVQTSLTAAVFHLSLASLTLNEEQVAGVVYAIGMGIGRVSALVANRNDVRGDAFAAAFVKNKVFADEFVFDPLFFAVVGVFDDATFELVNICKTAVLEPS